MNYAYTFYRTCSDGHSYWVAKSLHLKGCVGQGETAKEAISELEQNEEAWLQTAKECGIEAP